MQFLPYTHYDFAVSQCTGYMATIHSDHDMFVLTHTDLSSGKTSELWQHSDMLFRKKVTFSVDFLGDTVVFMGGDDALYCWSPNANKVEKLSEAYGDVDGVVVDDDLIALYSEKRIYLLDQEGNKLRELKSGRSKIRNLILNKKLDIALCCSDKQAFVVPLSGGKVEVLHKAKHIHSVRVSEETNQLVVCEGMYLVESASLYSASGSLTHSFAFERSESPWCSIADESFLYFLKNDYSSGAEISITKVSLRDYSEAHSSVNWGSTPYGNCILKNGVFFSGCLSSEKGTFGKKIQLIPHGSDSMTKLPKAGSHSSVNALVQSGDRIVSISESDVVGWNLKGELIHRRSYEPQTYRDKCDLRFISACHDDQYIWIGFLDAGGDSYIEKLKASDLSTVARVKTIDRSSIYMGRCFESILVAGHQPMRRNDAVQLISDAGEIIYTKDPLSADFGYPNWSWAYNDVFYTLRPYYSRIRAYPKSCFENAESFEQILQHNEGHALSGEGSNPQVVQLPWLEKRVGCEIKSVLFDGEYIVMTETVQTGKNDGRYGTYIRRFKADLSDLNEAELIAHIPLLVIERIQSSDDTSPPSYRKECQYDVIGWYVKGQSILMRDRQCSLHAMAVTGDGVGKMSELSFNRRVTRSLPLENGSLALARTDGILDIVDAKN